MKKTRIAMVILCLIYIATFVLSMVLSQPIREGKVADDWIVAFSLVMAATLVANIVLSHRYATKAGRSATGWAIGALVLPFVVPIVLASVPAVSSSISTSSTPDSEPSLGPTGSTVPQVRSPARKLFAAIPVPERTYSHKEGLLSKSQWSLDELRLFGVIVPGNVKWWVAGSSEEQQYLFPDLMPPEDTSVLYDLLDEWSSQDNRNVLSGIKICLADFGDQSILFPLTKLKKNIPMFLAGLYHFREQRVEKLRQWLNSNPEVTLRGYFGSKAVLNKEGCHLKKKTVPWADVRRINTETLNGMSTNLFVLPEGRSGGMFDFKKGAYALKAIPTGRKELYVAECSFWNTHYDLGKN